MRYEAREETTGQIVLNPIQVKLLKDKFKKEIHRKLTPKKLLRLVARQVGFIGRKSDGNPGWLTLMRGMCDLIRMEEAYTRGYEQAVKDVGKG